MTDKRIIELEKELKHTNKLLKINQDLLEQAHSMPELCGRLDEVVKVINKKLRSENKELKESNTILFNQNATYFKMLEKLGTGEVVLMPKVLSEDDLTTLNRLSGFLGRDMVETLYLNSIKHFTPKDSK